VKKTVLILVLIVIAAGLYWFFKKDNDATVARKKALEEKLAQIPFTVENLFPEDSTLQSTGTKIIFHRLVRNEINDSTLPGAQIYLNSLVIGLVRADVESSDSKLNIEIAQFASPNDAYGFYSQGRPRGVPFDTLGTESYFFDSTFHFTKSDFVVAVTSHSPTNKYDAAKKTAKLIDAKITQRSVPSMFFRFFPYRGQLVPSQKYYSLDFLGVEGLDEIYTMDYAVDEDTLTLFFATDTAGSKFVELSEFGKDLADLGPAPPEFEYPEEYALSFEHPEKGRIVAFLANRRLAGVIGYNRATGIELATMWIKGLQ